MTVSSTLEAPSRASRVRTVVSPRGIEAWLVEDYAVPLVALEFSVRGGSAQDPAGRTGAATMLAGLLDEGAGPLSSQAFQRALEDKAIELHFSADRDGFTGRLRTLARHADVAFELLGLALDQPRLDVEPIERVRGQLSAAVRREAEDPDSIAARAFREHAFAGHPYSKPPRGTLEDLARIGRDDLVALKSRTFARDTLQIAVVGAIDPVRVASMLDAVFGPLPEHGDRAAVPAIEVGNVGARHVVDLAVPQATIRFGRKGIARKDPDHMPAVVVNHILGGGVFSARLFREVREKRGLAYSVHSQLANFDHAATLSGGTSTKNERAMESLDIIQREIRKLSEEGPGDEELEKAKRYLVGSYALRFDTSTKIAAQLVALRNDGFDVSYLDERNKLIGAVTLDEAKRVARRLLGDGDLLVVMVGQPVGASPAG